MRQGAQSRHRIMLVLLLAFLLLPVIALLGFFSAGAVLSSPAALPHHADLVVVLGGGDGNRYPRGRDLVLAGYSEHLLLISPSASERKDAKTRLPEIEVMFDNLPRTSWMKRRACAHACWSRVGTRRWW